LENAECLLEDLRTKGLAVEFRNLGQGRVGLFILPPENMPVAQAIVEQQLPALTAPAATAES
jgi:hypothetical protein